MIIYDDEAFFAKYSSMERSRKGLEGAGEWAALKSLLPDFVGKRVLDLGCGFGWHCGYALEHGAARAVGVDISEKMLAVARTKFPQAEFIRLAIEEADFPPDSFDVVLSSLAFHYVEPFEKICRRVHQCLSPGGDFVFSVEHPVFTAEGSQRWHCDEEGKLAHWPVNDYFREGPRRAVFLGEEMLKYHRTLTTYLDGLGHSGFQISRIVEPQPDKSMLERCPEMAEELRRPMMLIVAARRM